MATKPDDKDMRGMARPVNDDLFAEPAANSPTIRENAPATMSSREIAELTGKMHAHVLRDIRNMLAELEITETTFGSSYIDGSGRSLPEFALPKRETMILVSGYSVALRAKIIDRWQELEAGAAPRALTQIEVLLQSVQLLANVERQQREQAAALVRIEARVEEVGSTQLLTQCPSNAEPITRIRIRMAQRHGLSTRVIDHVMRQHPSAPKPAGMVRNDREEANGSTYAVYWQKDVTAVFDDFVKGCKAVVGTLAQYTHPLFGSDAARFTMRARG